MSLWSKIRGTTETLLQLGKGGPQVKNNAGSIDARDPNDAAYVNVRGLDPVIPADLVTKNYADARSVFTALWTAVAAGTTQVVAANAMYAGDTTGARINYDLPSAPADGTTAFFKNVGATVNIPPLIVAGAGDTVEDPTQPGSFSSVAGSVPLPNAGQACGVKYQAANTRWLIFSF